MSEKNIEIVVNKIKALKCKREEILKLDPEDALDAIMSYEEVVPLVHSFPEQSLYMLMHEVGHEDFLPILSFASKKQWEYLIDMEVWEHDIIDIDKASYWLGVLYLANAPRLADWLLNDQDDFFVYYLRNKIDVVIREHDEDPSIIPDDYITFDDVIYFKIFEKESEKLPVEIKRVVQDMLARIAEKSYALYQTILFIAAGVINAEHLDNLYRLKNARLEGKGLIPFDEAIEIYSSFSSNDIQKRSLKDTSSLGYLNNNGSLDTNSLVNIFSVENYLIDKDFFSLEFISLCNRIIVADKLKIRAREDLKAVAERISGVLKIGAQQILDVDEESTDQKKIAYVFSEYSLIDIFKIGHTLIKNLRTRIISMKKNSWFKKNNFQPTFLGEEWFGIAGGLFLWPPLYFDNFKTSDRIYKNFISIDEIRKIETELDFMEKMDSLFALLGIREIKCSPSLISWDNFLLTLWARDWLHLEEKAFEPIPLEKFILFYSWLFSKLENKSGIDVEQKQDFLTWLIRETEIDEFFLMDELGGLFDRLFLEIEQEYSSVDVKSLDSRYIKFFIVE